MQSTQAAPAQHQAVIPTGVDVHLWVVRHDDGATRDDAGFMDSLSVSEVAQFNRFRNQRDRDNRTLARAALRSLLGTYLDTEPPRVAIRVDAHGKPRVDGIECNCSHAPSLTLIAIAADPVGVDIEPVCAAADIASIRDRFMNDLDQSHVTAMPAREASIEMLKLWVVKEACLKAIGVGLSLDPRELRIRQESASQFCVNHGCGDLQVRSIETISGHIAAVAARRIGSLDVHDYTMPRSRQASSRVDEPEPRRSETM